MPMPGSDNLDRQRAQHRVSKSGHSGRLAIRHGISEEGLYAPPSWRRTLSGDGSSRVFERRRRENCRSNSSFSPQQLPIPPAHQRQRILNQPEDPSMKRRHLPIPRLHSHNVRIDQNRRDLSVARAGQMPVERPYHQNQSPALECGQLHASWQPASPFTLKTPMKPQGALQTNPKIAVERNQDCESAAGRWIGHPKAMIARRIGDDHMPPVFAALIGDYRRQLRRIDGTGVTNVSGGWDKDDGVRDKLGSPKCRRGDSRQFRIEHSKPTPIDGRGSLSRRPRLSRPQRDREPYGGNPLGNHDYAAGIPGQSLFY